MRTAQQIADRVRLLRARDAHRDQDNMKVIAIRKGDYDTVAPGLFNSSEFDRPLVANLIDTTARDIAEVMAPLPAFNCTPGSLANSSDAKRQDIRSAIANYYVQHSRLQDQMFGGADRYGSFGFMAYIVEPDFEAQCPVIRVSANPTAHYTTDFLGRTQEFVEVYKAPLDKIAADFPDSANALKARFPYSEPTQMVEIAKVYDNTGTRLILLDPCFDLTFLPSKTGRCSVRVLERPTVTGDVRGQFDDVIWVQVARALVQMYTMNALEQSVNAPIAMPKDVQEMEIGPLTVVQSDNPQNIGRVNLQLSPGLFPEQQILAQEQRTGSRYPEGRSGSIDASIVTGQGVQALMGTFDTQVQTFQRLNISALEDVLEECFRIDEAYWGDTKKTCRVKDNGAPRKFDYVPSKDIAGDHIVDVTYGAIAGLDPNRGLIFALQAVGAGLIAKSTARRTLPMDLNLEAEEREIQLEQMDDSFAASLAAMPQALPQMVMGGMDPRELVLQLAEVRDLIQKGKAPHEAAKQVFAPKEAPQPQVDPMAEAMAAAQGGDPAALPGQGGGGASDLLMTLAGMSPSGNPQMSATVSRYSEI